MPYQRHTHGHALSSGQGRWSLALAFGVGLAWLAQGAQAQVTLTLHYQDRPPYSFADAEQRIRGLVAEPAARAFERAGIAFNWAKTPSQRQLVLIQNGNGLDCGVGWFRNPERETLGRFTRALYQDRPFMALARRASQFSSDRPLATWLGDSAYPLLVKDGYSYGALLDQMISRAGDLVRRTSTESAQMVRMIEAGRAGWMIVAPEEAQTLLAELGPLAQQLQLLPLAGVPAGSTRHIYCSRAVPETVIERLDVALATR